MENWVKCDAPSTQYPAPVAIQPPAHGHTVNVANLAGTQTSPAGNFLAARRGGYAESGNVGMHSGVVGYSGASQGHLNLAPYLTITFCIALQGIFPSHG